MILIRKTRVFYLHLGASGRYISMAGCLRKKETEPEQYLWDMLKSRKCGGHKFRRQHPIHFYIADFYCHEKRLIIEVDGKIHLGHSKREKDQNRTAELERLGIRVIRFTNEQVLSSTKNVLIMILNFIDKHPLK